MSIGMLQPNLSAAMANTRLWSRSSNEICRGTRRKPLLRNDRHFQKIPFQKSPICKRPVWPSIAKCSCMCCYMNKFTHNGFRRIETAAAGRSQLGIAPRQEYVRRLTWISNTPGSATGTLSFPVGMSLPLPNASGNSAEHVRLVTRLVFRSKCSFALGRQTGSFSQGSNLGRG